MNGRKWESGGGLDSRPGTTRRTRDTTVGAKLLSLPIVCQRDVAKPHLLKWPEPDAKDCFHLSFKN